MITFTVCFMLHQCFILFFNIVYGQYDAQIRQYLLPVNI